MLIQAHPVFQISKVIAGTFAGHTAQHGTLDEISLPNGPFPGEMSSSPYISRAANSQASERTFLFLNTVRGTTVTGVQYWKVLSLFSLSFADLITVHYSCAVTPSVPPPLFVVELIGAGSTHGQ